MKPALSFPVACLCLATALESLTPRASAQLQRVNLAKLQSVQASSSAAGDPAVYATDGIVGNGNRWKSEGTGPHWLAVTLPLALPLGSAQLFLGRDDIEPVASFSLQYWNGAAWSNIPGATISGSSSNIFNLVFPSPVTTSRVRFYSTEAVVRLREIALFAPNGSAGYPIGADVTLNLAKKRPVSATSVDADNYAKEAVDGYVDDASRWKSAEVTGPHRLEVDLEESSRVGSAHVYFGTTAAAVPDFSLEWWNGSGWASAPGGSVIGNTNYSVRLSFTTPVTTSRVRLTIPANGSQRVRELLVFAANGSDGYPLGTDAILAPRPGTVFDSYGDGYWKIVNRAKANSLIVGPAGAGQTIPTSTEEEKLFQVLYNIDSDTFRLRNRDSYLCIGATNANRSPGTPVVEMPDYQGMPHELWRFEAVGGGDFRIVNVWNGLALETDAATVATVTLATPAANPRQYWRFQYDTHYPKKGTGGYESDWAKFRTSWNYNWGRDTGASLPAHVTFTPMQHNRWWPGWGELPEYYPPWHTTTRAQYILGFNEPEQASQGNISVTDAIALWPKLEASDVPLVSPVPVNAYNGWLGDFYNQANSRGYRVDFTAVHWYGNPDANGLINHLQSVYNTWGRPVWLTEFSTVDWGGSATWTEEDNYRFLYEFLWRAEDHVWLKRYAMFVFSGNPPTNPWDRTGPRSDTLMADGATLTAFGELYAAWDGDRTLRDRTAYLLHNRAAEHRLRASSTTSAPSAGSIRRSDVSTQWALVPTPAASRWLIVSLRDGRRLRFNGSVLDLAPPGTTGAFVEWNFNGPDGSGYTFVDHPATSKSLRLNRSNDGSGAPTSLDFGMETFGTVANNTRWRFIKPHQPVEVVAPAAPTGLTATGGVNRVTLSWPATTATDFLRHSVYRRTAAGGSYARIITGLTVPGHVDLNVVEGVSYRYVVTTTDWLENESSYSPETEAGPLVPGTYAYWAFTAFGGSVGATTAFGADPDGDGLKNGLEYAFLGDPLALTPSPFVASLDAAGKILIRYVRNRSATDLEFEILASPDLSSASWQAVPTQIISQMPDGPLDQITVRPGEAAGSNQFYRLSVQMVP